MRRLRPILLRFLGNRLGTAAIEFALVVPILLVLVCSTLEAGWIMVQTIMLDRALDQTVRELRVGSFVAPNQAAMRARVCAKAVVLHNCEQAMALELIPITSDASYPVDSTRCIDRNSPIAPVLRFTPGGRSQTMFVRACFVVSPMTPGLGLGMALPKDPSGAMRIISKSAFVNEPL